jgi:beta-aspartyl-peptidase (threonine type)
MKRAKVDERHRRARRGRARRAGAPRPADRHVAISATGDGEAILRVGLARTIALQVAGGTKLGDAAIAQLRELHAITGGSAGLIAIDHHERACLQLSPTMPVAWIDATGAGDSLGAPSA